MTTCLDWMPAPEDLNTLISSTWLHVLCVFIPNFFLLPGPVMQDKRYRVVSLFSGIAGLELGLRQSCTQELSSYFLANKTYHHIRLKDDSNSVPTSRCYCVVPGIANPAHSSDTKLLNINCLTSINILLLRIPR